MFETGDNVVDNGRGHHAPSTMPAQLLQLTVGVSADAPRRARHAISDVMEDDDTLGDVLLATSELITNALRYGGIEDDDPIRLELRRVDGAVRVTISYEGVPFDISRWEGSSGFGFRIVDSLATRWDIGHNGGTTSAWFEI